MGQGNGARNVPSLVVQAGGDAQKRFIEFFAAQIRNKNTREAYLSGPSWVFSIGPKTPNEAQKLIRSIPTDTVTGLRDQGTDRADDLHFRTGVRGGEDE